MIIENVLVQLPGRPLEGNLVIGLMSRAISNVQNLEIILLIFVYLLYTQHMNIITSGNHFRLYVFLINSVKTEISIILVRFQRSQIQKIRINIDQQRRYLNVQTILEIYTMKIIHIILVLKIYLQRLRMHLLML